MIDEVDKSVELSAYQVIDKNSGNKVYIWLLFLLSPLLTLFIAFKYNKASWAKNILWMFVAFHGMTMVISNEGIDASQYKAQFIEFSERNLSFFGFLDLLYTEESNYVDIVQPLISYFLSIFTSNSKVLFLVFGLIFGYFYSRNIWYLLQNTAKKLSVAQVLLLTTFSLIVPFWYINGFRMWTAAVIFFYGAIQYLYDGRKKGFVIAAASILVHFSFVLPMFILIGYTLIRNKVRILFWLFIASFLIAEVDLGFIRELLSIYLPNFLQSKVEGYTNEEYAQNLKETVQQTSVHAVYFGLALKWAVVMLIILVYIRGGKLFGNQKNLLSLFCFTLLFLAVANITSLVPSGGRFITVAHLFAIALVFFYIHYISKEHIIYKTVLLLSPAFLFYCIVSIRIGFDTMGLNILGNPILVLFLDAQYPLIDLIK